jgi:hypothetical protein
MFLQMMQHANKHFSRFAVALELGTTNYSSGRLRSGSMFFHRQNFASLHLSCLQHDTVNDDIKLSLKDLRDKAREMGLD